MKSVRTKLRHKETSKINTAYQNFQEAHDFVRTQN